LSESLPSSPTPAEATIWLAALVLKGNFH